MMNGQRCTSKGAMISQASCNNERGASISQAHGAGNNKSSPQVAKDEPRKVESRKCMSLLSQTVTPKHKQTQWSTIGVNNGGGPTQIRVTAEAGEALGET
jgi:hypothetical protein